MKKFVLFVSVTLVALFMSSAFNVVKAQYCYPVYSTGCTNGVGVVSVSMFTWTQGIPCDNLSGYYQDFTSVQTDLTVNGTYDLHVIAGADNTLVTAWIDYNQDGSFDQSTEKLGDVTCTTAGDPYTITFSVPGAPSLGNTWMRIMSQASTDDMGNYITDAWSNPLINGNCIAFMMNFAPPATAATDLVENITVNSATLNGTFRSNGAANFT